MVEWVWDGWHENKMGALVGMVPTVVVKRRAVRLTCGRRHAGYYWLMSYARVVGLLFEVSLAGAISVGFGVWILRYAYRRLNE